MASFFKYRGAYYAEFYNANRSPSRKRVRIPVSRERDALKVFHKYELDYAVGEYDPWRAPENPLEEPELVRRLHVGVSLEEAVVLINVSRLYRYGMTEMELYDTVRGVWRVGERREGAKYAFAIFQGVVREVFTISAWLPAGSTMTSRERELGPFSKGGRFEFVGDIADTSVRHKYLGKSVKTYLSKGAQNPIKYINC